MLYLAVQMPDKRLCRPECPVTVSVIQNAEGAYLIADCLRCSVQQLPVQSGLHAAEKSQQSCSLAQRMLGSLMYDELPQVPPLSPQ